MGRYLTTCSNYFTHIEQFNFLFLLEWASIVCFPKNLSISSRWPNLVTWHCSYFLIFFKCVGYIGTIFLTFPTWWFCLLSLFLISLDRDLSILWLSLRNWFWLHWLLFLVFLSTTFFFQTPFYFLSSNLYSFSQFLRLEASVVDLSAFLFRTINIRCSKFLSAILGAPTNCDPSRVHFIQSNTLSKPSCNFFLAFRVT